MGEEQFEQLQIRAEDRLVQRIALFQTVERRDRRHPNCASGAQRDDPADSSSPIGRALLKTNIPQPK
jgi:hypothetical protein